MLLTFEEMDFLGEVTDDDVDGKLKAKEGLTPEEKGA